jgi:hypothetical protein
MALVKRREEGGAHAGIPKASIAGITLAALTAKPPPVVDICDDALLPASPSGRHAIGLAKLAVYLGSKLGLALGDRGIGWVELGGLVEQDTRLLESGGGPGLAHRLQRSAVVTVHVGQVDLGLALLGVRGFESLADGDCPAVFGQSRGIPAQAR